MHNAQVLDHKMAFEVLPEIYSLLRYPENAEIKLPESQGHFLAIIHAPGETTVITSGMPTSKIASQKDEGWKCIKLCGTFAFTEVGILASISNVLRSQNVPVCCISTFDTDYFFVKEKYLSKAMASFENQGWSTQGGTQ